MLIINDNCDKSDRFHPFIFSNSFRKLLLTRKRVLSGISMEAMGRHDFSVHCRHVDAETSPQDCIIKGSLPSWIRGDFISTSSGVTKVGKAKYEHLFDALVILQKFEVTNGKVQFSSKFLQSDTFKINKKAGKIIFPEFATPGSSCKSLLSRIINVMDSQSTHSDNASDIIKVGSRFYCRALSPFSHEIDPKTLDVVNKIDLYKLCKMNSQTSKIFQDKNGYFYTIGLTITILGPKYALVKYPKDGNLSEGKIVATFNCRWKLSPSFIHGAAITENHLIFIETPLSVSILNAISEFNSASPAMNHLKWHEDKKCIVRVIELETWKESETKYVTDPFFNFCINNAYEEDGHIVLVMPTFKDFSLVKHLYIEPLRDEARKEKSDYANFVEPIFPYLHRYVLPLDHIVTDRKEGNLVTLQNTSCKALRVNDEIHLTHEVLEDVAFSSGVTRNIHFTSVGKNKFFYNHSASRSTEDNYISVTKLNVDTKEKLTFYEEDLYISRPVFIADPDGQEEDDGVLLSLFVLSSDPTYVGLLILSAKTMTEICRIHTKLKTRAPIGLNAVFAPDSNSKY